MKITYLKSASVLVEDQQVSVLCDPWLVDGEYYGSWAHYPPCAVAPEALDHVDYIYISHIHPDHFSRKTLQRMNRKIPVLIHSYSHKFLKMALERLGFTVRELPHNQRTHLKKDLHITILAADNCNPEACGRFFGCGPIENRFGGTQIDSLMVLDNGRKTVVNVNDCPYGLARDAALALKKSHPVVDLLLVGYTGAGPYPQCFQNLTEQEKVTEARKKERQFLLQGEDYIRLFAPRYYLPFAGRYTLAGGLAARNDYRGVIEPEDAMEYFSQSTQIDQASSKGLSLNSGTSFDLESETASAPYARVDRASKRDYIERELATRRLDYETEAAPSLGQLLELLPKAHGRFERKRDEIKFKSGTAIYVDLVDSKSCRVDLNGGGYQVVEAAALGREERFVRFSVDPRLLKLLLAGPQFAHWNNAEIGSHITFERAPNVYERGLYFCMNFFHA